MRDERLARVFRAQPVRVPYRGIVCGRLHQATTDRECILRGKGGGIKDLICSEIPKKEWMRSSQKETRTRSRDVEPDWDPEYIVARYCHFLVPDINITLQVSFCLSLRIVY